MRYLIEYFVQFRKFIGRRIYYLLILTTLIGFAEGIGVTLFLPVLQNGFKDDKLSRALGFVLDALHLKYSFVLILAFILFFFILRGTFILFYAWYFGTIAANLIIDLRRDFLDKIFKADYVYILKKELGYINNTIVREIACVVDAFSTYSSVINYTIYGLVYVGLTMLLNVYVSTAVITVGVVLAILMRRLNLLINKASLDASLTYGKFHSILIQALSKLKYLKATLSEIKISKIINRENTRLGNIQFKLSFLASLSKEIMEIVVIFIVVGLLFYYVVIFKKDISEVIFLAFLFLQVARQMLSIQTAYRKFLASRGSIETFNNFLRELDENEEKFNLGGAIPDFENEILLRGVSMIFPNGKKALDDVNIIVKPRFMVALVGHSGSGKSTIANMVTGILKPTSGEVFFGGTNYGDLNLKALREKIGYVTQEDVIFNASIKDNITLWDENVDADRLRSIIEMSHITRFVDGLKQKEDEILGDNGLDISGGQRQRVTIARELYKEAKILILDEATSSLDSKSEKAIYENMKRYKGEKTMLVIAHRLSTIKNADYIYVFDEGRIVEEGAYEELVRKTGEFKKMIDDQRLMETEATTAGSKTRNAG